MHSLCVPGQAYPSSSPQGGRKGFTLVELLVVIAIIGVLVALLLPAIQSAREAARRMSCQNNLKNIGLACLNYENARGELPPGCVNVGKGGDNGDGWPLLVLPYVEQDGINNRIKIERDAWEKAHPNDPFDGYDIAKLFGETITIYTCPTDDDTTAQLAVEKQLGLKSANYAGVMGSYSSRRQVTSCSESTRGGKDECAGSTGFFGVVNFDGLLSQDISTELRTVTDGTSNTLMIGERWYQLRVWTVGGYWTKNPDASGPRPAAGSKPNGPTGDSAISACKNVDARYPINGNLDVVGYYQSHVPGEQRPYNGSGKPATMSFNDLLWGSFHPGGANFVHGDGNVRFISESIDMNIFLAKASKNGGEVTGTE